MNVAVASAGCAASPSVPPRRVRVAASLRAGVGSSRSPRRSAAVLLAAAACGFLAGCGSAEAERRQREQKAEFHFKLAAGYFHNHNIELAIRELVRAFDFEPEHAESRYLYGFILFGRKRFEEAAENFRRALARNPKFYAARNHLGVTYLELERFHEAIEVIEPLLKEPLYTTPYLAHNNIGWAYLRLGNLRNAEKHLRMAVFINPKFCLGHFNLGLLAKEMRDLTAAVGHLEDATRLCADYAEAWWQLGEVLAATSFERSQDAFRRCHALRGDAPLGRRCAARVVQQAPPAGSRDDQEGGDGWR